MYRLAICDDDTEFAAFLEKFLRGFFSGISTECSVDMFPDTQSLNAAFRAGREYDLLFLDILFESDNGMSCAKQLRAKNHNCEIIFTTICREYAIESYDVNPLYYIVKPINTEKLTKALNRFFEKHSPNYICFNTSNGIRKIRLSDILYFEIYGHRVIVHKSDGSELDFRGSLKEIEAQLPLATFIRPHRSYLVNTSSITEIMHYSIKLTNGEVLPISKALYNRMQLEFVDFLDKRDLFI